MKPLMKIIFGLTLASIALTASAGKIPVETQGAFEIEPTVYFLGKSLSGVVQGQQCEQCPIEKLTITPATKAFVNQKEVSLSSKAGATEKPSLVIYDLKTKKVIRLVWSSYR